MSFESIKNGFITFLNGKLLNEELAGKEVEYINYDDEHSIFTHANEFKNYVSEKLDTSEVHIFSKSVSDILKMDVENGKLIDKNAEDYEKSLDEEDGMFEDNPFETDETTEDIPVAADTGAEATEAAEGGEGAPAEMPPAPEGFEGGAIPEGEGEANVVDILNDFFGNQTVIDALDVDGSGDLSKDEIQTFITDIAGFDGDVTDITLDDIFSSVDLINDEEYVPGELSDDIDINDTDDKTDDTAEDTVIGVKDLAAGIAGGGGGGGGGVNIPGIIAPIKGLSRAKDNTPTDTTDLKKNLSEAKADLSDKQKTLDNINSGKDEKLVELQDQIDDSYKTYQAVLKNADINLAKEVDDIEQKLNEKKASLTETTGKIFSLKNEISSTEAAYDTSKSRTEILESALKDLEATDKTKLSPEKKEELEEKIDKLKTEIKEAEKSEDDSKDKVGDKKKELKKLEAKQEKLNGEIEDLTAQKQKKEKEVEQLPEAKKALDAYNKAQKIYDDYKAETTEAAEKAVTEAANKVSDAQKKLDETELGNKKKEYSPATSKLPVNLFKKGSLYGKEDMVAEAAERHGIEPELLAGIICLESGYGTSYYCNNNFNPGGTTGSGNAGYTVRSSDGFHFAKYNSIEDGVEAMAANLESYKSRFNIAAIDIAHINQIGAHYCNSDWSRAVSALYQSLKAVE